MLKINLLPSGGGVQPVLRSQAEEELSGLHFLVHPLSIANPEGEPDRYLDPGFQEMARELGQRYRAAAWALSADEVFVVFLHMTRAELESFPAEGRGMMETFVNDLQGILGSRLFYYYFDEAKPMIREHRPLANDVRDTAKRLTRDLASAGLKYSFDIPIRFYGEELECCMWKTALYLTRQLNLSSEPRINVHLTDQFELAENDRQDLLAKQQELKGLGILLEHPPSPYPR